MTNLRSNSVPLTVAVRSAAARLPSAVRHQESRSGTEEIEEPGSVTETSRNVTPPKV